MGYLKDIWTLIPVFLGPRRAEAVYDALGERNNLGESSLYLNLGYWDGANTYDGACEALAKVLAEAAGLKAGERLLDCGFGFADQDLYWAEAFSPAKIVGLNITRSQVRRARERVSAQGLSDVVELLVGSATAMPVADAGFDKVTALETAFHYQTREDFFREAYRVLRPGGRIATADIIPLAGLEMGLKYTIGARLARMFWQIPPENMYPEDVYRAKLAAAGFRDIRIVSIREKVYAPFARFMRRRLEEPEIVARLDPLMRRGFAAAAREEAAYDYFDYVIATATRG